MDVNCESDEELAGHRIAICQRQCYFSGNSGNILPCDGFPIYVQSIYVKQQSYNNRNIEEISTWIHISVIILKCADQMGKLAKRAYEWIYNKRNDVPFYG